MTPHNWVKKYEKPVMDPEVYRYKCIRCGIEAYGFLDKIEPFYVDTKDDCDLQIIDSIDRL